ncbi:secretion system protein E [Intrasporangium chromatireducens Q5-1]|uniref:Secretion system protein E n=1 Tax=Intrasporangium chromatireducens Q5-1 TaxID=584657 RepID=W9GSB7_9MICO|nr:ATPase, T2SS/T4P/T4SS family [Intrasporangium chromatireducens]EWT06789.1 secretion system protein E [Intrasporangium chromatireducens Q5-1]
MGSSGIDWALVAAFRSQASEQLSAALGGDRSRLDRQGQRELGRSIILELLEAAAAVQVSAGRDAWTPRVQQALATAIFDALFGLGRLQPLVDDDRIENIIITGHETVRLELTDGTLVPGPPVADSDEELIDFLVFLASRSEVNARPFSEAQPRLHLRLDGGARLAAAAWVTPRPSVVIRRHRLRRVTLEDLVGLGMVTPLAASFLAAAIKARRSLVVAGPQGAGKTTMVRALCAQIPPHEAIGTFETEYELHLHELPERHPIVHAWEARPGSGERGPDGRPAGEFSLDEALYDSFRFNLSRQIVGEVRGREVLAMIKAMESGAGSISTTHAASAEAALRKLVTCAMEAGAHVTQDYATRAVAENIDLVVQLHLETTPLPDGSARRDRWVSEIIAVTPGEREKGYATTHVFAPSPTGPAQPAVLPDDYRDLQRYGFDLTGFHAAAREAAS